MPEAPISQSGFIDWLNITRNDLQRIACKMVPKIDKVLGELKHSSALLARMSGSGSTCFGIFANAEKSLQAMKKISQDNPDWWVIATRLRGAGPVL